MSSAFPETLGNSAVEESSDSEVAKTNGRSMNTEIVARLQGSLDAQSDELSQVASGVLLDEVIARYGAQLQVVMPKEAT